MTLRLGVIGLGRRWSRYRQALFAMEREAKLVAVHDPVQERAESEARDLGCLAVSGIQELIDRGDVDALLVCGGCWHGFWSVERAALAGKPVLCAFSPVEDEDHLDSVPGQGVHFAPWPALMFAAEALSERLRESLGRPLFAQATWTRHGDRDLLRSSGALALLLCCAELLDADPRRLTALPAPETIDCATLQMQCDEQRLAQVTMWGGPAVRPGLRIQIEAEGGPARLELPRGIEWHDRDGRHSVELPGGLAEALIVDRFVKAVRNQEPPSYDLESMRATLGWLRAARWSRETGQSVELPTVHGRA